MIKVIALIILWGIKAFITFIAARNLHDSLKLDVCSGGDKPRDIAGFVFFIAGLWGVDVIVFTWGMPW
jgi:hypothetical protein